jgi:hypothetical protein
MRSPKLRAGPLAALVVLALFAVSAAAQRVYVYEVESDVEITEDVPHVPGISWQFGEQLLVVWVPRDVAPGIILFTNETAPIPLYDRKHFLLVVPADARPNQRARVEALLKTPDGTHPVVFRKPDAGILHTIAHSIEDALTTLKQIGLQPEYRGKAELRRIDTAKRDPDAGRETDGRETDVTPTQVSRPSINSTFDVYGGLYFRETLINRTGRVIIPVHGTHSACINVEGAAYVGYDAKGLLVGTLIRGGRVDADLIVEVYRIQRGGSCTLLGAQRFVLMNGTTHTVRLVNLTASVNELAVVLRLDVRSYSGSPRVSAYASLIYTRTYRYGFEVGEFSARTAYGIFNVWSPVRRIVIGPYVAYDGYIAQTASSSLTLRIVTQPEGGTCKDLRVRFTINGNILSGTSTYRGQIMNGICFYNVNLPSFRQQGFEVEYFFSKALGGGLFWVLDIEYTDGSTPYVRSIALTDAEAFRYWRWVEQWKTIPDAIDGIWGSPLLSSALQLYAGPTEPTLRPKMYHGLVTIRTDTIQRAQRVVLTISGREIHTVTNRVAYIASAEIDLWMQVSVRGIKVLGAAYLMPDYQLSPIAPHGWVREAFDVKRVVDFILMLAGVVGRVSGLLGFATGEGLKSAGDAVKTQVLNENTARITYRRGWYTNVASDTIIIPLIIPSLSGKNSPTELEIRLVCLDGLCVSPRLKAYVQPDSVHYATSIHRYLKNWMFRGQTSHFASYFTTG